MKINIQRKSPLDERELQRILNNKFVVVQNYAKDLYLFMNEETANELDPDDYTKTNARRYIMEYDGHKVFVDPDLKYGEIELR